MGPIQSINHETAANEYIMGQEFSQQRSSSLGRQQPAAFIMVSRSFDLMQLEHIGVIYYAHTDDDR